METEFHQEEMERLVALERKFGKEGLTFDDVLLVPAESRVLPNDVSTATRLTRELTIEIPIVSAAMSPFASRISKACAAISAASSLRPICTRISAKYVLVAARAK